MLVILFDSDMQHIRSVLIPHIYVNTSVPQFAHHIQMSVEPCDPKSIGPVVISLIKVDIAVVKY